MAPSDDPAEAAARLEAALERISQNAHLHAHRRPISADAAKSGTEEVAARLDVLIHQLRTALDGDA